VVGVYDFSQATELPRAYVVLQPSVPNTKSTTDMIAKFVENNTVNYKKLRGGVFIIKQVPKSPSGKILRREVREWIKKEQEKSTTNARL
jgi:4-coumarate--CoA ligase